MPSPPDRSPFDRPRWTERDAREVLAALRRSGKPVSVFAAEHGLDPQRVHLWRRRLGGAERTTFQELIVRPPDRVVHVSQPRERGGVERRDVEHERRRRLVRHCGDRGDHLR